MAKRRAGAGYRVRRGINWPDGQGGEIRAEPDEVRTDIPAEHVAGLIENGAIEPADLSGDPAAEEV